MTEASLLFLLRGDEVLLARKKRGFGQGKITGIGGRLEPGETPLEASLRETLEETGVAAARPRAVARLAFRFPHRPSWSMDVHVFTATCWQGEPAESDEVAPLWLHRDKLPLEDMWDDARYWLPPVLAGQKLTARFVYDESERVADYTLSFT